MHSTAYDILFSGWSSDVCSSDLITLSSRQLAVVAQLVGIFDPACFQEIKRRLFDQGGNARLSALSKVFDLCRQLGFHRRCEIARVRAARPDRKTSCRERVCQYV